MIYKGGNLLQFLMITIHSDPLVDLRIAADQMAELCKLMLWSSQFPVDVSDCLLMVSIIWISILDFSAISFSLPVQKFQRPIPFICFLLIIIALRTLPLPLFT